MELHRALETVIADHVDTPRVSISKDLARALLEAILPIPVVERLPEFQNVDPEDGAEIHGVKWSAEVLAWFPAFGWLRAEYWQDGDWHLIHADVYAEDGLAKESPTHWLPLPSSPIFASRPL